ncbi:hypothetical protein DSL64_05190 [Dyadobacter luteus]|uniref:Porin n=1 Tax=Dyadobacter luteus TaxID=2259619 RepID=A0A3D8YFC8_9BACT|nr:putative porin [Dyadobacter luteus]REA63020.1 hypothetical protein DSL64_05190 [Dyadobacter luteus]
MRIAFSITLFLISIVFWQQQASAQVNLPAGIKMPGGSGGGGLGSGGGGGAVLDDSTKNIYGPKTTLHYFENDILNNRDSVRYLVDTSLTNFHRWSPIDKSWGKLVDLGNALTASRSIFFQPRQDIGTQLGMRAYDTYAIKAEEVQYIDTKSQHTYLSYINGGKQTSLGKFGYSQNAHSRFNFGLNFERFTSNKQYGSYNTISSGAFLGQNWTMLMHTSFFSKDKKYLLLAHYRHLNQKVREQGGVMLTTDAVTGQIDPYPYDGPARISDNANSWERRHVFHVYQQYKLANGFQLFQQGEYSSVINRYTDRDIAQGITNGIYKTVKFDTTTTRQDIYYKLLDTKLGFKGYLSGFNYRAYYRPRLYGMNAKGQDFNTSGRPYATYRTGLRFDNIVGAWLAYYLKDSAQHLTAEAELNLSVNFEYNLKGELSTKWGKAGVQIIQTAPDLLTQRYLGNHFDWRNNFNGQKVLTFYGSAPVKSKKIDFTADAYIHQIVDYIYYDTLALPTQYNGRFGLYRIGATTASHFKRWNFAGMAYFSGTDNSDIFKVPNLFASGEVTYDFVYAKVLHIQLGLAARYRSTYFADAYMPVTQQFHRQNTTQVQGRVITDAFANIRISRVRLFFQMSYVNMNLWGAAPAGYYITPTYMGQGRAFSFGVLWPLFD